MEQKKLTKSVGSIHGKEKTGETDALDDRCSAVHVEGPADGNIVQGRQYILCTKCMSSTDCGHNLFCTGATFSDFFQRESSQTN